MKTINLQDGTKLTYDNDIVIITKKADSYYRSSIPCKYKEGMHDTRGVQNVFSSEKEALDVIFQYALDSGCDNHFVDDNYIEELKNDGENTEWYEGEGVYCNNILLFEHGDKNLEDDLRYYEVTTFEDEIYNLDNEDYTWSLAVAINSCSYDVIEIEEPE